MRKKYERKKNYFCILKVTEERSRIPSWIRYGSPDPHQNVTDPQHCVSQNLISRRREIKRRRRERWWGPSRSSRGSRSASSPSRTGRRGRWQQRGGSSLWLGKRTNNGAKSCSRYLDSKEKTMDNGHGSQICRLSFAFFFVNWMIFAYFGFKKREDPDLVRKIKHQRLFPCTGWQR